ncbi:hypothetical protein DPMN_103449 [Dreissena polymorpha]|uniref:Uncharacterized protein n=1 Tax=Dreissena polymorpha TaxID=45954 RepID=A0A9D4K2N0_DREPO|nr:hypothetical protein DPMN_103449 [Dreissena polymorpha]
MFKYDYRPGVVAYSCNPATLRPGSGDCLRPGALLSGPSASALSSASIWAPRLWDSRLIKEERTGSGWKHSRQKFPCRAVVGSRP